jgi:hypothetical protein
MAVKTKQRKVSLLEYADKYNKQLNRRGKRMSWAYLYRLIRQDIEGTATRPLWFKYTLEGEKDRIWILLDE